MAGKQWVFAYGSLIWDPGFPWTDRLPARLYGYHRAFCIHSWHYRGSRHAPGLVLGLDRGGSCRGVAYGVATEDWREVVAYLDAREMVTSVYVPRDVSIHIPGKRGCGQICARAYVTARPHEQYAGRVALADQARIITHARGHGGANVDYLHNTLEHLRAMHIHDPRLEAVARLLPKR
ncbi:MAG: gamma-glutamylcyclotransferase [Sphingomonadales bacterium]